jgi:hypothetical protein
MKEGPGARIALASGAAQLLVVCARDARDAGEAEQYWNSAIGLLDRLCDVGASERRAPGLMPSRWAGSTHMARQPASAASPPMRPTHSGPPGSLTERAHRIGAERNDQCSLLAAPEVKTMIRMRQSISTWPGRILQ